VGATAPDIAGMALDGNPARLADYQGRPVLVNFWATWCPPCRLEMPWLEEAYRQRQAQGLAVLAVNAGERTAPEQVPGLVRDYVTGAGLSFPVLLPTDPDRSQYDYQAFNLPTTFLVDPEGKVHSVIGGAFPNRASLNAQLDAFLGAPAGQ
jgi:thiol-disulfide isomerase/thioredoxin